MSAEVIAEPAGGGGGVVSARKKRNTAFLSEKKRVKAWIRRKLKNKEKLIYLECFDAIFPRGTSKGYFKQYFERWAGQVRLEPKVRNVKKKQGAEKSVLVSKRLPRRITTHVLHPLKVSANSSIYKKKEHLIIPRIIEALKRNSNARFDYAALWREFFPHEHKVSDFSQFLTRLINRERIRLGLRPVSTSELKKPAKMIVSSKRKEVPVVAFKLTHYSMQGLPQALQKYILENPGKPIPTMQFAIKFGAIKEGEREKIREDIKARRVSLHEGDKRLADFERRWNNFEVVTSGMARKIERGLGVKKKRRPGLSFRWFSSKRKPRGKR